MGNASPDLRHRLHFFGAELPRSPQDALSERDPMQPSTRQALASTDQLARPLASRPIKGEGIPAIHYLHAVAPGSQHSSAQINN